MENEAQKEELDQQDSWELYDSIPRRGDLTFRDDQHDFDWFMDALKQKRWRGVRFRLVDSGLFAGTQLERLMAAGADIYTSDGARKDVLELEFILKAARKSGTILAFFLLENIPSEDDTESLSLVSISHLGKEGLIVHVSSRERERNFADLVQVAVQCRQGAGRLVYYHHQALSPELIQLAQEGAWVHLSDCSLQSKDDLPILLDTIAAARSSGSNLVLYVEKGISYSSVHDIIESGAVVLFKTSPKDFKSPMRPLEEAAKRKRLDFRACYLYSTYML